MATRIKDMFFHNDIARVILDISVEDLVVLRGVSWSEFESALGGSVYKLIKDMNTACSKELGGHIDPDNSD